MYNAGMGLPFGTTMSGHGASGAGESVAPSEIFSAAIIPFNEKPSPLDHRMEEILGMFQPTVQSEAHRKSVMDFVALLIKKTLGAQCFAVGPFASKAYLPDDEVALSAFLCRGQENTWFIR